MVKITDCKECKMNFSNTSNLRGHVKRKHPDKLDILAPKIKFQQGTYICKECGANFTNCSNLRVHVKRKHPDKLDILAPKIKFHHGAYICKECGANFTNCSNLRVHVKRKHPGKLDDLAPLNKKVFECKHCQKKFQMLKNLTLHKKVCIVTVIKEVKCPLCQFTNPTSTMIKHYREMHSLQIDFETLEFESFEAFKEWKIQMEKKTFASFVNMHGFKQGKNVRKIKYTCHRSGNVTKKGKNIRALKTQGSNKINAYCPAEMNVEIHNGKCLVKFCKSHVGHRQDKDLGHLFLSTSDRQLIAAKIASKIPFQTILDDIRDSISNCHLDRLHLLTKKDLYNIEQAFNLNKSAVRHTNDAISVDIWVNDLKSTNSVLFYKPQESTSEQYSELKAEDFMLIIMTEGQKELLLRFGDDCICVDGTHGLNGYGFELHTLLVLDDIREGYPCAFLISNRSDSRVMNIFFSCVKENIGKKIHPQVFMSDMADAYYNAWLQVMEPAKFRLYCTWHVDKAWRKNLEKIATKEKKALIYRILRILLHETDISAFEILLQKFLVYCQESPETNDFGNYFHQYYGSNVKQWAYCYRLRSGLNTNMHIERMHRTIKHLYLNGKFVQRLDKAIEAILKFVRDKVFERLIVVHKGKVCSKLSDLRHRHKISESLDLSKVVETDMGWIVPSTSNKEMYVVEELQSQCLCKLVCSDCFACIHRFTCSCLDCSIKWNMCKHIHLVCRFLQQNPTSVPKEVDVLSGNLIIDLNDQTEESENLVSAVSVSRSRSCEQDELHEEQLNLIQKLQQEILGTTSKEELEAIKKIVLPIKPTLAAIRNNKKQTDISFLPTTSRVPFNKKIEPQRRLFKTTKKSTKQKQLFALASSDEAIPLNKKL